MGVLDANHVEFGRRGESLVADYLSGRGWHVLDRNWRCDLGEVDIIALDPSGRSPTLVVVEVKTRAGTGFGWGAQAVTRSKYQRLRRLAARWLQEHPLPRVDVRIDVVSVLLQPGMAPRMDHVCGAFR